MMLSQRESKLEKIDNLVSFSTKSTVFLLGYTEYYIYFYMQTQVPRNTIDSEEISRIYGFSSGVFSLQALNHLHWNCFGCHRSFLSREPFVPNRIISPIRLPRKIGPWTKTRFAYAKKGRSHFRLPNLTPDCCILVAVYQND